MDTVKQTLRVITAGFAVGPIILVLVVALIDLGEPENPELADGAALAVAVVGALGLLIALLWHSQAGERPRSPRRVQIGFIVRLAIAELGLLLGVLAVFTTGAILPVLIGLALFLLALLFLYLGLSRVYEA
ncbi:MAG: hypothetical protein QNJ77_03895 [Acidimicrobiia bacterium]|nr:hypothetical protein [Acidimicrobiia bacterium]